MTTSTLTPFRAALRTQHVGDVWARPGLSRKDRRWISLTCVAHAGEPGALEEQVFDALDSGDITIEEMLEFALHFAVYCGSPKGSVVDGVVGRQWAEVRKRRGEAVEPVPVLPLESLGPESHQERLEWGAREFAEVNLIPAPQGDTPFRHAGVLGFIFGHVWQRPGLSRRERRIVTIAVNGIEGTPTPVRTHVRGALVSGDVTETEMNELVLHFAAHQGFAKGKTLDDAVGEALAEM